MKHPGLKVSDADIPRIMKLRREGWYYYEIAVLFNVDARTISAICRRKRRSVPSKWHWNPDTIKLLGTMTDKALAKRLDLSSHQPVQRARARRGIKPFTRK